MILMSRDFHLQDIHIIQNKMLLVVYVWTYVEKKFNSKPESWK